MADNKFNNNTRVKIRIIQKSPERTTRNYREDSGTPLQSYRYQPNEKTQLDSFAASLSSPTTQYGYNSPSNKQIQGYSIDRWGWGDVTTPQYVDSSNYMTSYIDDGLKSPTTNEQQPTVFNGINETHTHTLQHPYSFHGVGFEPPTHPSFHDQDFCARRPNVMKSQQQCSDTVHDWVQYEEGRLVAGLLESQGINPMKHSNLTDLYMKKDFFDDLRKCLSGSYLVRYHPRKVGQLFGPDPVERYVLIQMMGLFNGIPASHDLQPIRKQRNSRVKRIDDLPRSFPRAFIQTRCHEHPKSDEFGRYGLAALVGVTRDVSTPGFGPHRVYHDGHVGPDYLEQMIVPIMPHPINCSTAEKNKYRDMQKRLLEALRSKVIGVQGDRLMSSKQFKLLHADNAFVLWFYDINTGKADIVELCASTAALADLWVRTMKGIVSVNSCRFAPKPNKIMLATAEESVMYAARRLKLQKKLGIEDAEWHQGEYYHNIGNNVDNDEDSDDDGTWINRRMPSIDILHAMCRYLLDNAGLKSIENNRGSDGVRWIK